MTSTEGEEGEREEYSIAGSSKRKGAKLGEGSSVNADWLCTGCPNGASIYYVGKIFEILLPLPPFVCISRNLSVLSFAKLANSFTPSPFPRLCKRNKWITPKLVGSREEGNTNRGHFFCTSL